jgi:hypothetical protein
MFMNSVFLKAKAMELKKHLEEKVSVWQNLDNESIDLINLNIVNFKTDV